MQDYNWWTVKVKTRTENAKGKEKFNTEQYLVYAVCPTDAEVVITKEFQSYPDDWFISSVTQTRYIKILDPTAESK